MRFRLLPFATLGLSLFAAPYSAFAQAADEPVCTDAATTPVFDCVVNGLDYLRVDMNSDGEVRYEIVKTDTTEALDVTPRRALRRHIKALYGKPATERGKTWAWEMENVKAATGESETVSVMIFKKGGKSYLNMDKRGASEGNNKRRSAKNAGKKSTKKSAQKSGSKRSSRSAVSRVPPPSAVD